MSLDLLTDSELLNLLQQGDEKGFTEIFDRYWKVMFVVASNKTGDLDEAEETDQRRAHRYRWFLIYAAAAGRGFLWGKRLGQLGRLGREQG